MTLAEASPDPTESDAPGRPVRRLLLAALAALLFFGLASGQFADPDMWHEMALFREAWRAGELPREDVFAYTPTVTPSVHHEWGTGAILYAASSAGGSGGILLLRYALAGGIAVLAYRGARRRGSSTAVFAALAPLAILLGWIGLTTVRAQVFSLLLLAILLVFLERDRRGDRRWIVPWVLLHVLWVNLHAGFVVGLAFLWLHTGEELLRRRPARRLLLLSALLPLLAVLNPYGVDLFPYLWHALRMPRPAITEWAPIWDAFPALSAGYVFSLVILAYALLRAGAKRAWRAPGLAIVLVSAYAALRHQRHVSIYALAWIVYVPAYLEPTLLGSMLRRGLAARPRLTGGLALALALGSVLGAAAHRPWQLDVPARPGDHPKLTYPVGAVDYLARHRVEGNVMVPFTAGAFVSWKLHPAVRVSIDGRYEVAYPAGALEETLAFYDAEPGWRETLARHPTDLVLVRPTRAVYGLLEEDPEWRRVYIDDAYALFARAGLELPAEDARGADLVGEFP